MGVSVLCALFEECLGWPLTACRYMHRLNVPNGLSALGYTAADIPAMVQGTLPQKRVLAVAPQSATADDLHRLFEDSMVAYR